MKMSRLQHWSGRLRFETARCINAMIWYLLVPRVGEHYIRRVREVERMGRIRRVERIKGIKEVEEANAKIR